MDSEYEFDLFVIGGGSGGLAAAQAAAGFGARVGVADYVKPSPVGTKWGLGGTCVNVGCIPKKLMHFAAGWASKVRGSSLQNIGFNTNQPLQHDWNSLVSSVQMHIKKTNWGYKSQLTSKKVQYFNMLAKMINMCTVSLTNSKGEEKQITAKYILIAVGGRPSFLDGIDSKLVITSDDLFSLKQSPGKVLIVGASYIALECAGFLNEFGYDVTVMVRSIFLRGFDQEIANKIAENMEKHGVKFIRFAVPKNIQDEDGKRKVTWFDKDKDKERSDVFDTVMLAIGRTADTGNIGLEEVEVEINQHNKKIFCNDYDETTSENIFAIGDCVDTRLELTPTAIKAGKLLAARLFDDKIKPMDYKLVPTTVFTPLEYGCIGLSEEDAAIQKIEIKAYVKFFNPLEYVFSEEHAEDEGYVKIIVAKAESKENEKILGFHYLGPSAGEVTQGFAVAVKMGATKKDFENCVAIHPTYGEEVILTWQDKSGDIVKESC